MIWKAVVVLGLVLCVSCYTVPVSEQHISRRFSGHHGDLSHIGDHAPEHHEVYAWSYPSYEFSYHVNDPHTHDNKGHQEVRNGDRVDGSYWLIQPDGRKRIVNYYSDHKNGFHADVDFIPLDGVHHEEHGHYGSRDHRGHHGEVHRYHHIGHLDGHHDSAPHVDPHDRDGDSHLHGHHGGLRAGHHDGHHGGLRAGYRDGHYGSLRVGNRDGHHGGTRAGHHDDRRDGHHDGHRDGHRDGPRDGHRDGHRDGPRDGHRDGPRDGRLEGHPGGQHDGHRDHHDNRSPHVGHHRSPYYGPNIRHVPYGHRLH